MRGQADKLITASIRRATQQDLSVEESTETWHIHKCQVLSLLSLTLHVVEYFRLPAAQKNLAA